LRPRNRLGGVLDLFHLCEIQFQTARSGDLHTLREAVLLESFPGVRTEFTRVGLAAYAVELIERATEKEAPVPEIFDLLQRALRYLHAQPASQMALRHLEAELARLLGIAEPGTPAATALARVLHRLPSGREELLHQAAGGVGISQNEDAKAQLFSKMKRHHCRSHWTKKIRLVQYGKCL
jgi:hypothetical protein